MTLIISDSFSDSLNKLNNHEQSAVKQTAFDLQVNPANPGLSFHRIDKSKDKYFWSVRVNRNIRIIVHKRGESVLMAYVDHHDEAYKWAEKRRLDVHPRTGAAQIVEIRERVEEIVVRRVVEQIDAKPPVMADESDDTLLDCGVPEDWLEEVRNATEDTLLDVCAFLPAEASEAVLNLAVGIRPKPPAKASDADPFKHPDARRRFWKLTDVEELRRAMHTPWGEMSVSVEKTQRDFVAEHFQRPRTEDKADRGAQSPGFPAEGTSAWGRQWRAKRNGE